MMYILDLKIEMFKNSKISFIFPNETIIFYTLNKIRKNKFNSFHL